MEADCESIGMRIRCYRKRRGWSQLHLARKVSLSQKQLSRVEASEVTELSRTLIIQIAHALKEPLVNGEINAWLYSLGFRSYIQPQLDLPPNYPWLKRFSTPAFLIDAGWFIRDWNQEMACLLQLPRQSLNGLENNLIVQLFAPGAQLTGKWPDELLRHMLHRLMIQWQPYHADPWLTSLKESISRRLGRSWTSLFAAYHITSEPSIPSTSELVAVHIDGQSQTLRFRSNSVAVPLRPDLSVTHYYPLDKGTEMWCQEVKES